ncbi:MAG: hypothetical protein V5A55_04745 [Halovenus sp.]
MEFDTITVRGEGASELLTEVSGPTKGMNKTRYASEEFSVIAWERYDLWRTNSDLMVAVIMDLTDSRTCEVAIMVGGGGDELLGFDWSVTSTVASTVSDVERSAEAAALEEAVEYLEKTCNDLTLNIAPE